MNRFYLQLICTTVNSGTEKISILAATQDTKQTANTNVTEELYENVGLLAATPDNKQTANTNVTEDTATQDSKQSSLKTIVFIL